VTSWYLYLIRCGDGSIYTGISTDVARRLAEHRSGKGARYLRGRGPLTLARKLRIGGKSAAFKLEWRVKRLPRKDTEKLIAGKIKLKDLQKPPGTRGEKGKRQK
jgi:putative endonuclease